METSTVSTVSMTELLSAFFVEGIHRHNPEHVFAAWNDSHSTLLHELLTYAGPLASQLSGAGLCIGDIVGDVFLFQVAEPFGSWFAEVVKRGGRVPERGRASAKLADLVNDFYVLGEHAIIPAPPGIRVRQDAVQTTR